MNLKRKLPDQKTLHSMFKYDADTGHLTWRVGYKNRIGKIAGCKSALGYTTVGIKGKYFYAHRLVYTYVHGGIGREMDIDHINGNKSDNRIANLRLATRTQNLANSRDRKRKFDLPRGVVADGGSFRAHIKVNNKRMHLGNYKTPEDASSAYRAAAQEMFGQFARTQ